MAASSSSSGGGGGGTLPRRRKEYKTLVQETQYEESIKKSRFLTRAAPCKSFVEAQDFLRRVSDPKVRCVRARHSQLGVLPPCACFWMLD